MPINKSALLRYKIIDRTLRNKYKPYPSVEELRQACEDALFNSTGARISRSTIEKDLFAMRSDALLEYEAPIAFNKKRKGYYYTNEDYSISQLPLKNDELQAIRFAASTLHQFRDIPFFTDFYTAIEKIFSRVAVTDTINAISYDNFLQFEQEAVAVQADHLPLLIEAIINSSPVNFTYVKFGTRKEVDHTVWPLLLKEYRNRWYLTCYAPDTKKVLLFGLDRMYNLKMGKGTFVRPIDFDPAEYFKYSIGITSMNGVNPSKVILTFSPSEGDYIRSKPLHASQKIITDNKKEFRVELIVQLSYELEAMILGYGEDIKVIQPVELVARIKERIHSVQNIYQRK